MVAITTTFEHIGHWIKMRQSLARFSGPESSPQIRSLADFIVTTSEFKFSVHTAAQIARRLGYSRNSVCAKLTRLGLRRDHKPPTANPKIVSVPKRRAALLAACARPADKVVFARKPVAKRPK